MSDRTERKGEGQGDKQAVQGSKRKGTVTPEQERIIRAVVKRRRNMYRELAKH